MRNDKYTLDGVREDASRLISAENTESEVIETAQAYYSGSAVEIDGGEADVIDCFLVAWEAKREDE